MDFESKVVGVTRHNHDGSDRQLIATSCRPDEPLVLRREPDNAQDPNAVAVFRENGDQVGYLSASVAEQLAPLLDNDAPILAVVSEVTGGTPDRPSVGVNIRIHDDAQASGPPPTSAASAGPGAGTAVKERATAVFSPKATLPARRGCLLGIVAIIGALMVSTVLLAVAFGAVG